MSLSLWVGVDSSQAHLHAMVFHDTAALSVAKLKGADEDLELVCVGDRAKAPGPCRVA
jgi:hypothetical protein